MQNVFSIAIDGPSGAGKSSVARAVAEKLGAIQKEKQYDDKR